MNAKQYLRRYESMKAERHNLILELSDIQRDKTNIKAVDYRKDRVQESMNDDGLYEIVKRIDNRIHTINARIKDIDEDCNNIIDQINAVADPIYKELLYLRYIKGYNLIQVSIAIKQKYPYTRELHGKALLSFKATNKSIQF